MDKSYVDISASECAKMLNLPPEKLEEYAKVMKNDIAFPAFFFKLYF